MAISGGHFDGLKVVEKNKKPFEIEVLMKIRVPNDSEPFFRHIKNDVLMIGFPILMTFFFFTERQKIRVYKYIFVIGVQTFRVS